MKTVSIDWEKVHYSYLPHYDDCPFYAFTIGKNLIYIGIAYHQMVDVEIKKTIQDFRFSTTVLSVWLGYFVDDGSIQRVSKQLVLDTECLLIHMNQPTANTQCKKSYTGRNNLKVISHNFPFVNKTVICKESEFFSSD